MTDAKSINGWVHRGDIAIVFSGCWQCLQYFVLVK